MTDLSNRIYHNEDAAREHLENIRWPDGPFCPHCGETENIKRLEGKSHRPGLFNCRGCRKQFSVTVGTLFERSKVPLHKWLLATELMCASKKGISSHQLHRMLGVTYKTAWFMTHRIREAMRDSHPGPMGGPGKAVEVDETYLNNKTKMVFINNVGWRRVPIPNSGPKVLTLVERDGRARSFHVPNVKAGTLREVLVSQIDRRSRLMTDEFRSYVKVGKEFAAHKTVNHEAQQYVRGEASTQKIENYFSIFKRGLHGTYQHVSETHLKRYLCEFDFRYNERAALGISDSERARKALKGIEGKRMTYRRPRSGEAA